MNGMREPKEFIFDPEKIRENRDQMQPWDWNDLSQHIQEIPIDFIRQFKDKINWWYVDIDKLDQTFKREFRRDINKVPFLIPINSEENVMARKFVAVEKLL